MKEFDAFTFEIKNTELLRSNFLLFIWKVRNRENARHAKQNANPKLRITHFDRIGNAWTVAQTGDKKGGDDAQKEHQEDGKKKKRGLLFPHIEDEMMRYEVVSKRENAHANQAKEPHFNVGIEGQEDDESGKEVF